MCLLETYSAVQCKASIRPIDNQPCDCTTIVIEVQIVHGKELQYSNYLCRTSDKAAVGTIYNVFSYDVVVSRD